MDWNKVISGLLVLMILVPAGGQSLEAGLNYYAGLAHSQGFEPGSNGLSLDIAWLNCISENFQVLGGMEFGFTGWGNQVLVPLAARWGKDHQVELEILNGMALYRQGPHYVGGAGAAWVYTFFRQKRHRLVVLAGLRFSVQPGYRDVSSIYSYLDLPLKVRWQFGKSAQRRMGHEDQLNELSH